MPSHISFHSEHHHFELKQPEKLKTWLISACSNEKRKIKQLDFVFCSDDYLLDINIKYLNHNYLTDVITFPYSDEEQIEGDVFISVDRVIENAKMLEVSFFDEICRVMIHGLLHLCGYRDGTSNEQIEMRKKEDYYLSLRSF